MHALSLSHTHSLLYGEEYVLLAELGNGADDLVPFRLSLDRLLQLCLCTFPPEQRNRTEEVAQCEQRPQTWEEGNPQIDYA